jgi:hypothetical protein
MMLGTLLATSTGLKLSEKITACFHLPLAEVFETVLTFIYTHELPQFEKHHFAISHVESLLYAADMYLLDAMKASFIATTAHLFVCRIATCLAMLYVAAHAYM